MSHEEGITADGSRYTEIGMKRSSHINGCMLACYAGLSVACGAAAAEEVTRFNFDTHLLGGRNLSFVPVPDLSSTPTDPGTFPGSAGDVWGVIDDNVNDDVWDNTIADPLDDFGVLPDNHVGFVFGAEDLLNPDNPSGTASATWTFDITGYTNISMSIDFAAMGNFDNLSCPLPPCFVDKYDFFVSVDGGAESPIFLSSVAEGTSQSYTLANGSIIVDNDPLVINGVPLRNTFQTITASVPGTGGVLTLVVRGQGESSEEVFVFDNIVITGTPGGVVCNDIDFNNDTSIFDPADIEDFLVVYSEGPCSTAPTPGCDSIDFNNDSSIFDPRDIDSFLSVYSEGPCF